MTTNEQEFHVNLSFFCYGLGKIREKSTENCKQIEEILETRKNRKSRQLDLGPKFWLQIQLPGPESSCLDLLFFRVSRISGFFAKILVKNPAAWINICVGEALESQILPSLNRR